MEQHIHVPAVVPAAALLDVVEAVNLGKLDFAFGGHFAHNHAARRGADVHGGVAVGFDVHYSSPSASTPICTICITLVGRGLGADGSKFTAPPVCAICGDVVRSPKVNTQMSPLCT